jgi:hypothetical protein
MNRPTGRGRWIKQHAGANEFGDVEIDLEGADEFLVVLSHNWPAHVGAAEVAELDQQLATGLVEGLSQRLWLSALGCRVHTRQVAHNEGTTPKVVRLTAMLAVRDAIAKATWGLVQAKSPEVA